MRQPVITVHLDNGTSHSFPVLDAQQVLVDFQQALERSKESFWVGSAVFNVDKVSFVCLGRPS